MQEYVELQSTLENLVRIELAKEDLILFTIKLSVDRLPSSLKQCFVYGSNFPQDSRFLKEDVTIRVSKRQKNKSLKSLRKS